MISPNQMQVKVIKTRIFKEREEIIPFILKHINEIPEKSVLVIASKIVALSEGRTVSGANIKDKEKLIKQESNFAVKTKLVWLTIKDGIIMASAGIDESNANGKLILAPKNSFQSAEKIRKELRKIFKVKDLGVIISDSGILPLRAGTIGIALGYAGFKGLRPYMGKSDIFGRNLEFSRTDVADSLATSAALCMGEGDEQQPFTLITNAPVIFLEKINKRELIINPKEDIFAPLLSALKIKNNKKNVPKK